MSLQLLIIYGISDFFLVLFKLFFTRRRYGWRVTVTVLTALYLLLISLETLRYHMFREGYTWRFTMLIAIVIGVAGTLIVSEYRDSRAIFTAFMSGSYIMCGNMAAKTLLAAGMAPAVVIAVEILVHGLFLVLLLRFLLPPYLRLQDVYHSEWRMLTLILVMLFGGMYLLYDCLKQPDTTYLHNLVPLVYLLTVYLLVVLAFQMLGRLNDREMEERERKLLLTGMEALKTEVGELHRAERRIAEYNHDSRHFVRMLQGMMAEQDYSGVEQALGEMQGMSPVSDEKYFCRNLPLNGVMIFYTRLAEDCSVRAEVDLETLPEDLGENDWELAMVIGDLLDNAVRTAAKEKRPEDRQIRVGGQKKDGRIVLEIRNRYVGTMEFDRLTGFPVSDRGERYGLGMRILAAVVKKWNGSLDCGVDGNWFFARVIL